MKKYICEQCEEEVESFKRLKKILGKKICKRCEVENRKNKRKRMIENDESLKNDLRELKNKELRIRNKENYRKKAELENRTVREYISGGKKYLPVIKGSKFGKPRQPKKSSCYLTMHEKQNLFRILVSKGCDAEEAKERIKNLIEEQSRVRKIMKDQNKSDNEIKIRQQELLEELWRY